MRIKRITVRRAGVLVPVQDRLCAECEMSRTELWVKRHKGAAEKEKNRGL